MQNTFTAGAKVRLKNTPGAKTGIITRIEEGFAAVRYAHKPGVNTNGYYPVVHLELVAPAPDAKPEIVKPAPEPTKPKATVADVLGTKPIKP